MVGVFSSSVSVVQLVIPSILIINAATTIVTYFSLRLPISLPTFTDIYLCLCCYISIMTRVLTLVNMKSIRLSFLLLVRVQGTIESNPLPIQCCIRSTCGTNME